MKDTLFTGTSGRWTPKRKLLLAQAIDTGLITRADAKAAFAASDEEIDSLLSRRARWGIDGLAQMKTQALR
jgi:hypothetical protein